MEIRPITAEEFEPYYLNVCQMLGFPPPQGERLELDRKRVDVARTLAAFDAGEMVATSGSYLFELTLPGGALVESAGVTAVAVRTTHRRRGLLRDMMRRLLLEARDRGEPSAILLASEGAIYERFGFGMSTFAWDVRVRPRSTRFVASVPDGRIRHVEPKEANELVTGIFDRARRLRPGQVGRSDTFWALINHDRKPLEVNAIYETPDGEAEGYARYRIENNWEQGLANHVMRLDELVCTSDRARIALWEHLLSADLVDRIEARWRPLDDPLRWMLSDPRAVQTKFMGEVLWLRPLDIPEMLGSRTYSADVDLVLEVADPFLDAGGRFRLTGDTDGASCRPTSDDADLAMSVADLGALVLGGVSPQELAAAGRIEQTTEGALTRAALAFRTHRQPWCNTGF